MRVNIENCSKTGSAGDKAWLLDQLVVNLKELRDRIFAGDVAALTEFFDLFRFNDDQSSDDIGRKFRDALIEVNDESARDEREACAQIVEAPHWKPAVRQALTKRAEEIRARGER